MTKPTQASQISLGNKQNYRKANPELAGVKKAYQYAEMKVERQKLRKKLGEVWD